MGKSLGFAKKILNAIALTCSNPIGAIEGWGTLSCDRDRLIVQLTVSPAFRVLGLKPTHPLLSTVEKIMKPLFPILATGSLLGLFAVGGFSFIQVPRLFDDSPSTTIETTDTTPRQAYNPIDLEEVNAQLTGNDPEAVALSAFGVNEPQEGNFEENIQVESPSNQRKVVTITQLGLADDSVRGMRYRVELEPTANQWRIVWAGRQQRCQPQRGSQEWTTELCL
ncbi:hypothetical protein H6G20_10185 [Desertifilum sp. FACHB-1129]|uniref:Uncharacterized protein n=2 Tax=Desertifilum tharense IPPAS B-1220 TaxID=1781255 RepID=A0ACD5H1M0_9CYAN|nr:MULTISPECIES: hypothetical protein [Desertifilum]MBD2312028.1 hypothetical protein [Desertifilum sp. FACHB-1129]MBD2322481.1 hypothetical protein [Desertifilum sp. FACHB-866]MBD2332644.1 hypothetical protein [Desertifilum sp. FACHB-868]MDA0211799.1 hypothetical protein [Cyanobacteria bacterium FC1]